ncbi:MAG: sigma-54 dependent transcriptional regulator [Planctomycetota bacterium]
MSEARVLIVDDDELVLRSLVQFLEAEGHEVHGARTLEEATEIIESTPLDLVLADVYLNDGTAFKLLEDVRDAKRELDVVLMTGYGTIDDAVQAIKRGATDYVTKPLVDSELRLVIEQCRKRKELATENEVLRAAASEEFDIRRIVALDPAMKRVIKTAATVANTSSTVLITGESGTGKTLLARAMHYNSDRARRPFVEVACGALSESLLESELFGHEAGAFTGATRQKKGKFEAAHGGTIFLDEVATASPSLQIKLLRVIQDGCFERVGGTETLRVDVRIILATNVDLAREVEAGRFREDLYYRINVLPVHVPPLRERPDDIPALARHFARSLARRMESDVDGFAPEAMEALTAYDWPGNVRELENIVERGILLADGDRIEFSDLPPDVVAKAGELIGAPQGDEILPLKKAMEEPERRIIQRALDYADGNRERAAELLGINRSTLFNKLRRLELNKAGAGK